MDAKGDAEHALDEKILKTCEQEAADRMKPLFLFFSIMFFLYGLFSFPYLSKFDPSITLWANL